MIPVLAAYKNMLQKVANWPNQVSAKMENDLVNSQELRYSRLVDTTIDLSSQELSAH